MRIIECEQRSPEWFECRLGIASASHFGEILSPTGIPSKSAEKYMYRLACEFVSKQVEETFQSKDMLRGIELEPEARQMYSLINDVEVEEVGFCVMDDLNVGCSPDGLVGGDGLIEIKCLIASNHVSCVLKNKFPTVYISQIQGQLFVTGRKWCDVVLFYPNLKPLIIRVERDEEFIKKLRVELEVFCINLETVINKIRG